VSIAIGFKVPITAVAADAEGHPTGDSFDASPQWSLEDTTLGTLDVSADGLSALLTPLGPLGSTTVNCSGAVGGKTITGSLPVTFGAGVSAQILLTLGTPIPA